MKFCPECGAIIDGKEICMCGYVVSTGEVDSTIVGKISSTVSHLYKPYYPGDDPSKINDSSNDLPPASLIHDKEGKEVEDAIYDTIRYCLENGHSSYDIEAQLDPLYQNNKMPKDEFILLLKRILAIGIDQQIKRTIEKIEKEK